MIKLTDISAIFESVVASITTRISGTITDIVLVGETYTITTTVPRNLERNLELKNGMFIEINDIAYQVSNVSATSFDIQKDAAVSISDEWKLLMRFDYGHLLEVSNTVVELDNTDNKFKVMPMLWLMYDVKQGTENDNVRDYNHESMPLRFAFIHNSSSEYKAEDRETNIINPILAPLVELFLNELLITHSIIKRNNKLPNYNYFKRYKYGSQQNNANYIGSTITDSIELEITLDIINTNTCNLKS